jgi:hypothetical protein
MGQSDDAKDSSRLVNMKRFEATVRQLQDTLRDLLLADAQIWQR